MDLTSAAHDWREQGLAILPGYLPDEVLRPAVASLEAMFPSAQGFHSGSDPRRERYLGDEFAGIDSFPFASPEVSLLAVHDLVRRLAETLLESSDPRYRQLEMFGGRVRVRHVPPRNRPQPSRRRAVLDAPQLTEWLCVTPGSI